MLQQRHVLERGGVEHNFRAKIRHQTKHAGAIADIGEPALDSRLRTLGRQYFQHGVQGRLRILDHQQTSGAEIGDPVANLGTDRTAPAGNHDGFAANEMFKAAVIDFHARPQQQIFDFDRSQSQCFAAVVERRKPAGAKPQSPCAHQDGLWLGFRRERARGKDKSCHLGPSTAEVGHDSLDVIGIAEHGYPADRVGTISRRRGEDADRMNFCYGTAFDRAQQHVGLGGAAHHQGRHRFALLGVLQRAGIAKVAISDART